MKFLMGLVLICISITANAATDYCELVARDLQVINKKEKLSDILEGNVVSRDKKNRITTLKSKTSYQEQTVDFEYAADGTCIPVNSQISGSYDSDLAGNGSLSFNQVDWELETCKKLANIPQADFERCAKSEEKLQDAIAGSRMVDGIKKRDNTKSTWFAAAEALGQCRSNPLVAKMIRDTKVGSFLYAKAVANKKAQSQGQQQEQQQR